MDISKSQKNLRSQLQSRRLSGNEHKNIKSSGFLTKHPFKVPIIQTALNTPSAHVKSPPIKSVRF